MATKVNYDELEKEGVDAGLLAPLKAQQEQAQQADDALTAEYQRQQAVVSGKKQEAQTLQDIAAKRAGMVGQVGAAYDKQLQSSLGDIRAQAAQGLAASQGAGARGAAMYGAMLQNAANAGRASTAAEAQIGGAKQQALLGAQGEAQQAQLAAQQAQTAAAQAQYEAGDMNTLIQQEMANVDKLVAMAMEYAKSQDSTFTTRSDLNKIASDYLLQHVGELRSQQARNKLNEIAMSLH